MSGGRQQAGPAAISSSRVEGPVRAFGDVVATGGRDLAVDCPQERFGVDTGCSLETGSVGSGDRGGNCRGEFGLGYLVAGGDGVGPVVNQAQVAPRKSWKA